MANAEWHDEKGKFKRGHPAKGRPKGSKNKITFGEAVRSYFDEAKAEEWAYRLWRRFNAEGADSDKWDAFDRVGKYMVQPFPKEIDANVQVNAHLDQQAQEALIEDDEDIAPERLGETLCPEMGLCPAPPGDRDAPPGTCQGDSGNEEASDLDTDPTREDRAD